MSGPREPGGTAPGSFVFGAMVVAMGGGLAFAALGSWRFGIGAAGVGLLLGAVVRTTLPDRSAGQLRIRRRWSDIVWMLVLGVLLLVLAVTIATPPE